MPQERHRALLIVGTKPSLRLVAGVKRGGTGQMGGYLQETTPVAFEDYDFNSITVDFAHLTPNIGRSADALN